MSMNFATLGPSIKCVDFVLNIFCINKAVINIKTSSLQPFCPGKTGTLTCDRFWARRHPAKKGAAAFSAGLPSHRKSQPEEQSTCWYLPAMLCRKHISANARARAI